MSDNINFIAQLYKMMSEEKILLSHLGDITPDITEAMLKRIKNDNSSFEGVAIKKKIYKIIVECLGHIGKHSNVLEKSIRPSIFLLGKHDAYYYIATGNYIYNKEAKLIRELLDELNSMDKKGIQQKFIQNLSVHEISVPAGIELIDIAIKSENHLEYEIIPVQDDYSFYILKIKVNLI